MTFRCGFTVDPLRFYNSVVAVLQYFYCGFTGQPLRFYNGRKYPFALPRQLKHHLIRL